MTLSKRAIRPHQTQYLLDNGYLPVSIDHRLCPEIDLIAGPMTDVRDAVTWLRKRLPGIAQARGIVVDPTKVIAIGWSTGGHLAMTTAWTCGEVGQEPPAAILSFYSPTNFESEGTFSYTSLPTTHVPSIRKWKGRPPVSRLTFIAEIDRKRAKHLPGRKMSLDEIRKSLPTKPVCISFIITPPLSTASSPPLEKAPQSQTPSPK